MVRSELDKILSSEGGKVDKNLLFEFVESVTAEKNNVFRWGLWLKDKPTYFRMRTEGRAKKMTAEIIEPQKTSDFDEKSGKKRRFSLLEL